VAAGSEATLTCNTFSGWATDLSGATQAPCITTTSVPGGSTGTPYSATITTVGGTAPYTYRITSGTVPPGLTLAPDGTLSGTPTAAGTYTFIVQSTDAHGATDTQQMTVTISAPTSATTQGPPVGVLGTTVPTPATTGASSLANGTGGTLPATGAPGWLGVFGVALVFAGAALVLRRSG
jgi:hypothetical protein